MKQAESDRKGMLEATLPASRPLGSKSKGDAIKAGSLAEKRRLAICDATYKAVAAGAYEVPPRAGSLGYRRTLEDLLNETAKGRRLLAESRLHDAACWRRVPDRPDSVGCDCPPGVVAARRRE